MSNLLNPACLQTIAKDHPAAARALEIGIYALVGYLLGVAAGGEAWSLPAALSAFVTPLLAFVNKRQRDLAKVSPEI